MLKSILTNTQQLMCLYIFKYYVCFFVCTRKHTYAYMLDSSALSEGIMSGCV